MVTKQAVFQVNGEDYGLDIAQISTVEKELDIIKAENMPANIKGKVKLRGKEIPVYSLRRKFGIPEKEADRDSRYLITYAGDVEIAIEADHVKGLKDFDQSDLFDVPEVLKNDDTSYIKNIAYSDGDSILILDSEKLLSDEERKALGSFS